MREKLMTLPIAELKNIAKDNHIPNYYKLKKAELVEALLRLQDEKKPEAEKKAPAGRKPRKENSPQDAEKKPGRKPGRKPAEKKAEGTKPEEKPAPENKAPEQKAPEQKEPVKEAPAQ